jgi:hypothetical protein
MRRDPAIRTAISALALLGCLATRASAADLGVLRAPIASNGVACESAEAQAFDSVWLGHFTGGYSHRLGAGLPIVLDWRDEKLCFSSRRSCDRYMNVMRRDFHHPEGYFTCLPIR